MGYVNRVEYNKKLDQSKNTPENTPSTWACTSSPQPAVPESSSQTKAGEIAQKPKLPGTKADHAPESAAAPPKSVSPTCKRNRRTRAQRRARERKAKLRQQKLKKLDAQVKSALVKYLQEKMFSA